MLRPDKDKAFLIHFDHEVELDQDLTSSKENLRSALASLQAPQFTQTSGGNSPGQDQVVIRAAMAEAIAMAAAAAAHCSTTRCIWHRTN